MFIDEMKKRNFTDSLNSKGAWAIYARQLMKAALDLEKLERDESRYLYHRIKLMLVAFAFEDLIKAYMVQRGNPMADEGKLLKGVWSTARPCRPVPAC